MARELPLVLAITGASGAVYAARLLQCLVRANVPVHLVVSPSGAEVIRQEIHLELGARRNQIEPLLRYSWPNSSIWTSLSEAEISSATKLISVHDYTDYLTPIASGSFLTRGMVICPCSGSTLSGIVHASSNNLVVRAADVHLKEHRKLVLVPRETPLSVFQLENMHRAAQAGAIVLPAMPGWYHGVQTIEDIIDFVVARILDHLTVEHTLIQRWGIPPQSVPQSGAAKAQRELLESETGERGSS